MIFFDLDGVLSKFVAAALALHRSPLSEAETRWNLWEQMGLTDAEFWRPLGYAFWANLDPYPDGMRLFRQVEEIFGPRKIYLYTSPCQTYGCREGKNDWVKKHLPGYEGRTLLGSDKFLVARPDRVLIDDHDKNVDAFAAEGGRIVQPPRPWNRRHAECLAGNSFDVDQAMEELFAVLEPRDKVGGQKAEVRS